MSDVGVVIRVFGLASGLSSDDMTTPERLVR